MSLTSGMNPFLPAHLASAQPSGLSTVQQLSTSEPLHLGTPPFEHPPPTTAASSLHTGRPSGWLKKQPSFKWASYGRKASKGSPTMLPSAELDVEESATSRGGEDTVVPSAASPWVGQMKLPVGRSPEVVSPKTPTNANQLPIPHPATSMSTALSNRPGLPVSPIATPEPAASSTSTPVPARSNSLAPPLDASPSSILPSQITHLPPTAPLVTKKSSSSSALGSAQNPQKFKVTLDDPCWKVLPAALKKYKIQDDWRMYALFICYGSTGTSPPPPTVFPCRPSIRMLSVDSEGFDLLCAHKDLARERSAA